MPLETETPATVRAEAEARGRAAFENATKEPPTPAPVAWWETKGIAGMKIEPKRTTRKDRVSAAAHEQLTAILASGDRSATDRVLSHLNYVLGRLQPAQLQLLRKESR